MGYYIQGPNGQKAQEICEKHGGERLIHKPSSIYDYGEDFAIICVVDNIIFDAAGYCYSNEELEAFSHSGDHRQKTWLKMDKKLAEKLSGFNNE